MKRSGRQWQGRLLGVCLCAAAVMACGKSGSRATPDASTDGAAESAAETPSASSATGASAPTIDPTKLRASSGRWSVRRAPRGDAGVGGHVLAISLRKEGAEIRLGDGTKLEGEPRGGSRRYLQRQQLVAKVKRRGNPFEVRAALGGLLWKVWLRPDGVDISDDDAGTRPWLIRSEGQHRSRVSRGGAQLGTVQFDAERRRVTVHDSEQQLRFVADARSFSAMFGVLLIAQMPPLDQAVVMTEIAARGR